MRTAPNNYRIIFKKNVINDVSQIVYISNLDKLIAEGESPSTSYFNKVTSKTDDVIKELIRNGWQYKKNKDRNSTAYTLYQEFKGNNLDYLENRFADNKLYIEAKEKLRPFFLVNILSHIREHHGNDYKPQNTLLKFYDEKKAKLEFIDFKGDPENITYFHLVGSETAPWRSYYEAIFMFLEIYYPKWNGTFDKNKTQEKLNKFENEIKNCSYSKLIICDNFNTALSEIRKQYSPEKNP